MIQITSPMTSSVEPGKDVLNDILGGGLIADDQNREAKQLSLVLPEQLRQLSGGSFPAVTHAGRDAHAISDQQGRPRLPVGGLYGLVGHRSPPSSPVFRAGADRVWLILVARPEKT